MICRRLDNSSRRFFLLIKVMTIPNITISTKAKVTPLSKTLFLAVMNALFSTFSFC